MNHPFWTKKDTLTKLKEKILLCDDIITILMIKPDDHARVISRRDDEIKDVKISDSVIRRAHCLGSLVEKLNKYDDVHIQDNIQKIWITFLQGSKVDTTPLHNVVKTICKNSKELSKNLSQIEQEDNTSSYSDYSDSSTVTSDDDVHCERKHRKTESSGEEESGEDESSESYGDSEHEEENKSKKNLTPIKRRRR
jgi:hypothetical protein